MTKPLVLPVPNTALISAAIGVSFLSLMMSQQLGWFSFAFVLCCSLYRLWLIDNNNRNASKWLKKLFYLLAIALVVTSSLTGNLITTLLIMLVVAQGLTLLTLYEVRALFTLCWVQFFLTAASMMYLQSMHLALILFSLNFLLLFAIYLVYQPSKDIRLGLGQFKHMAKLVAAAIPICLMLFVLMPRLPPLWKMPKPPSETRGLQEQLKLGDLANLSRSDELAFRVNFADKAIERSQMYWRALTLDEFDGETWQQSELANSIKKFAQIKRRNLRSLTLEAVEQVDIVHYQVIAEASYQPWLFALDLAFSTDKNILHLPDFSLLYQQDLTKKIQYSAYSMVNAQLKDVSNEQSMYLPKLDLSAYLQLPKQNNPKTLSWLRELQQLHHDDASLIAAVLDYYNQQEFYYTLQPKQLSQPIIDNFLFNTREGFCEHYASSFAYVMRLAGIPSRLVIGYLGGEYNPTGEYYSVYQFDAHAWVELYLNGQWQKIDPTSYVAPERITQNLQQTLGKDEFLPDSLFSLYHYEQIPLVNNARLLLANLDYQWTRWILNYDINQQKKLLAKLFGQNNWWQSFILTVVIVATLVAVVGLAIWLNKSKKKQAYWLVQYQRACKVLPLLEIELATGKTPKQVLQEMSDQPANIQQKWQLICNLMDKCLYRANTTDMTVTHKQLKTAVNSFIKLVRNSAL